MSLLLALTAGLLFVYAITIAAVAVAILVGLVWVAAFGGALIGAAKRKAEQSKPSRAKRP